MNKIIHLLLFSCAMILFVNKMQAQTWEVPEENNAKTSPVKFDDNTRKKGEAIYLKTCKACHGEATMNNPQKLTPVPKDIASIELQNQTDGSLFYKLVAGRSLMPKFQDILTDEDRWNMISYIRSFNKKYVQPAIDAKASAFKGLNLELDVKMNTTSKKLEVWAKSTIDGKKAPVSGAEIVVFAQRYFGKLLAAEPKTTNMAGLAEFSYPLSLPGDKDGNLELIVKFNDRQKYGDLQKEIKLMVGKATHPANLLDPRSMWGVRSKAPIWLILAYSLTVIAVFSVILLIIGQIAKLKQAGKDKKNDLIS